MITYTVLTSDEKWQMAKDANRMQQDAWCKKYTVGDYQQYKDIFNNFLEN